MARPVPQSSASRRTKPPPLENGDRLDQKTFHERYAAMPPHVRAELIGGIVYMASPQKIPHSRWHPRLIRWLDEYEENTPGVELLLNPTDILGERSEPQPDACLTILPECGGRTWIDEDDYLCGPAELTVEIAAATESIDLNAKKRDYERAGVQEYLVIALRLRKVFWFVRRRGKFRELPPGSDGVFRSQVFPGLWLDAQAFLQKDRKRLLRTLRNGLASPEHLAFVERLARRRS